MFDVASAAYTAEADFGPVGGEIVVPDGALKNPAGLGVGLSLFGPGIGGAVTKSTSDVRNEIDLPKLPDENFEDPFLFKF